MNKYLDKILFYWFLIGSIVPNLILSYTEPLTVMGSITNVLLPLGIWGLLATLTKNVGKMVFIMFLFDIFAAFQIVLLYLFGDGIIAVDMFLNVITTNSDEATELLGRLGPIMVVVIVLYLFQLILGGYCIYKHYRLSDTFIRNNRKVFFGITLAGLICLLCSYCQKSEYDIRKDLYPVNIGYNLYLTFDRCAQLRNYHQTSADFKYNSKSTHSQDLEEKYILVIGESSRASSWELLGYDRPTNPNLSKRDDLIVSPKAYSESNTTHKSVPMLLSNVESRSFDAEMFRVKSIISAFKECGFYTSFISLQMPNSSYIEFFGEEADSTIYVRLESNLGNKAVDDNLLPYIKKSLESKHKKQLIVVNAYGSHFDYRDRYSQKDRKFTPDTYPKATKEYRKELVNAYDNSIVATDRFLNSTIDLLNDCNCVGALIYVSDHGEDIFDDGVHFLHASPSATQQQLHVPLIAWFSSDYKAQFPEKIENFKANSGKYISTSRSFSPTAMSVAGIISDKIDYSESLTSPSFKSEEMYYLNDHNKPLPFKPE